MTPVTPEPKYPSLRPVASASQVLRRILLVMIAACVVGSTGNGTPAAAQAATMTRISLGTDLLETWRQSTPSFNPRIIHQQQGIALIDASHQTLQNLNRLAHRLNRCGGYMHEAPTTDSVASIIPRAPQKWRPQNLYDITANRRVTELMAQLEPAKIFARIAALSAYQNRYYNTPHGEASQHWLFEQWQEFAAANDHTTVALYPHSDWRQPSVILTIKGEGPLAAETVIIGGHADSKARGLGSDFPAPGADDNASGIAVISQIAETLTSQNFRGQRTLQFIAYAAEEVGLRGSQAIAKAYQIAGTKVVGVLQLDMTNYKGSQYDLVLMSDYTDPEQNRFLEKLLATYLPKVSFSYDRCGYACSDHASWTRIGVPASIPFEATLRTKNPKIHTANDTLAHSNKDPQHSLVFAKLGLAYGVELAM